MSASPDFLVVDDHHDNRFLLTKTLLRKYPTARIHECQDSEAALRMASELPIALAIVHRTADMEGSALIRTMRMARPTLPILAVSGIDRRDETLKAGATAFLHYDAWLNVGTAAADLLWLERTKNPFGIEGNPFETEKL